MRAIRGHTRSSTEPSTEQPEENKLQEAIKHLPTGAKWVVSNWTGTDNGANIAAAIRQGTAVAVSDGSFKNEAGTAAFVLEGNNKRHRIEGVAEVPGQPSDQSAYRSELTGIFGIAVMITTICKIHNITEGSIEVGCNGLSALRQALEYEGDVNP